MFPKRCLCHALSCVLLFSAVASFARAQNVNTQPAIKNRAPLIANAMYLLPLTAIKPRGWLKQQLQIQADGLTGHLDEFWPDVGPNSGWLGGTGEPWERGPYYLDGLLPLAYLLDDAKLIAKAKKWVDWTLDHQQANGAIGPMPPANAEAKLRERYDDWWPKFVMLKVLTQYHEATGDARVIPLMTRYFKHHLEESAKRPLRDWGRQRWADELLSVLWLYNRTGDEKLFDLAKVLGAQGRDWKAHFSDFKFTQKIDAALFKQYQNEGLSEFALGIHGVNNAMALKTSVVWSQVSKADADRKAIYQMLATLDKYHGQPNGMFSADEHYAGLDPSQGIELCAVVEAMFSLEHAIAILGDPLLGDRLEKISYNAQPATMSGDMWSHQYDQQPNQVLCNYDRRAWTSNGPESNLFGMDVNFGCCTANMHQGWPKLAASLWMATADDGLAAVAYAPSEVKTTVKGNVPVTITEDTDYPFRDEIRLTINPERATEFPLQLRIPAWATKAAISVNGRKVGGVKAGTFHALNRQWQKGDRVVLKLPMDVRTSRWLNNSVVIERGPLVYSLKIGEDWRKTQAKLRNPAIPPAADWEVHPTTAWNYGLFLNPQKPAVQVIEKALGKMPFSADGAPLELKIKGRKLPEWKLVNGSAGPLPVSPVKSNEPEETLTLIPYGSAKLRVTVFPVLSR
ncbi:MAG TPA: beta-L-arabinofuranosidase domain-containing protein [Blastocatellia bacterium]|nr:beta-L-arabinofuranosidase domain-containing protein [Blastocatellia bacterium]